MSTRRWRPDGARRPEGRWPQRGALRSGPAAVAGDDGAVDVDRLVAREPGHQGRDLRRLGHPLRPAEPRLQTFEGPGQPGLGATLGDVGLDAAGADGVGRTPGARRRTPCCASCRQARASRRCRRARRHHPSPATDEMLMMAPRPRSSIAGSVARIRRMGAVTLTARTRSQVASSTSPAGRNQSMIPALLTSTSAPPCSPVARTTAVTPSSVARSPATGTTLASSDSAVTSSSSRSALTSAAMMTAPSSARRSVMALPMPDAAPVTMATRPSSLLFTVPPLWLSPPASNRRPAAPGANGPPVIHTR